MIHPVIFLYSNEDAVYGKVYQYWADATKLMIRVFDMYMVESPQANLTLEDIYNTELLGTTEDKIIEYKGGFWRLQSERLFDLSKNTDLQKFEKLTQIVFGTNNSGDISYATNIDPRADTAYFSKPFMYYTYFGLAPLLIMHPCTKGQSLLECSYTLYSKTVESCITNLPISHVMSPEEQGLNHVETDYMDITSLYCVPEAQDLTVEVGNDFELTLSTWGFDASVQTTRPTTFDEALLDTSINRTVFATVICDGYANITYAVNIVNGVGSINIPTTMYKSGDKLTITLDMKIPTTVGPLYITLS